MRTWVRHVGLGLGLWCCGCSSARGSEPRAAGGGESVLGSGGVGAGGRTAGHLGTGGFGQEPNTSNVFVDEIVTSTANKVDILFMIDNSTSMADKQAILKSALPVLPGRLMAPNCVDGNGKPIGMRAQGGTCRDGSTPEFAPIDDIHIGIVSSSLGSHGGDLCGSDANADDHAHLIGTLRPGLSSWHDSGFLAWDPRGTQNTPAGESDPNQLIVDFAAMVQATAEKGCAFEASLEAWYRFLIDPEPPKTVTQAAKVAKRSARPGAAQSTPEEL